MDIKFPLTYTDYGGLPLVDDRSKYTSHVNHILSTIVGERSLYPSLGFPIDLLYHFTIPELLQERLRLAIAPYLPIPFTVRVNELVEGKAKVEVIIGEAEPIVIVFDLSSFN